MKKRIILVGLACLLLVAAFMVVNAATSSKLTITITDKGILVSPKNPMGGDYTVIVKNMTNQRRGVELTGLDIAGTPYMRYSKIIGKGKHDTFKWYFPEKETAFVKDVLRCEHGKRGCILVTFGGMKTAIRFQ